MKTKQVQVKAKQQNGVQKQKNVKAKSVVSDELVDANLKGKKGQKPAPKKVPPPKKVEIEEEEEDDEDDESDSGADVQEDQEADSDDDAEDDDDDEEDDDEDEAEDDDDEDDKEDDEDAPTEKPVGKAPKGVIPKINTGDVPKDIADNQVVCVQNLPKKFKQVDIFEIFSKFGTIHTINVKHNDLSSVAIIAFTTAEAAKGSLAANKTAKVRGSTISVALKTPRKNSGKSDEEKKIEKDLTINRSIFVNHLDSETTEDDLKEHFAKCGTITLINIYKNKAHNMSHALITFKEVAQSEEALKLTQTCLNGKTIQIRRRGEPQQEKKTAKDPKRTIILMNKQELQTVTREKIEGIFSKCGEVEVIDILCRKVLAFVQFKDVKSAQKALKMNGKQVDGIDLEINEYKEKVNTTVFVSNVKPGITEAEIRAFFSVSGPIESVFIKPGSTFVKFESTDGFCKSFLLNEAFLGDQRIFIQPHSVLKAAALRAQKLKSAGKRPQSTFVKNSPYKKFKPQ